MAGMVMAPEWDVALLGWPIVLAQTLIFGSALLYLIVRFRAACAISSSDTMVRALVPWWRFLTLISAMFSGVILVDQVAGMAGVDWCGALPLLGDVLRRTHSGNIWEWRLPLTLALLIAAWIPMREAMRGSILLVLCTLVFLTECLMSHTIDFGAASIASLLIHMITAGTWTGALFGYWIGTRAVAKSQYTIDAAQALSTLAIWSVPILAISGIYIAYEGLGRTVDHLLYSSYGRVLSLKVAIFAAVLATGAYNRIYLMPTIEDAAARSRLLRNVAAESLMIVGVIGLAALLASTPPARMSMAVSMRNAEQLAAF